MAGPFLALVYLHKFFFLGAQIQLLEIYDIFLKPFLFICNAILISFFYDCLHYSFFLVQLCLVYVFVVERLLVFRINFNFFASG